MMKTIVLLSLGLLPIVVVADMEAFVHMRQWHLVLFGLPALGAVLIALGKLRKRTGLSPFGAALLVAGAVGGIVALPWNGAKVQASTEVGDQIYAQLEEHKQSAGTYPSSLKDLVPDRFESVPVTSLGVLTSQPFDYVSLDDGREFSLVFFATPSMLLRRVNGKWSAVAMP